MASPKVIIDGVFFQINQTGIARVWKKLLEEWKKSNFSKHIIVINRGDTAPKIDGIRYCSMPLYDYREKALESERLQAVCDQFQADLFISTYYTTPLSTPSILMVHDMIPEVIQLDLQEPCWQEKYYSILYANRYICVSQNTANDLLKFYPHIDKSLVNVIYNGIDETFETASDSEILGIKQKLGIKLPYFLLVGSRMSLKGYKNTILFFKALAKWEDSQKIAVVCVGGEPELEKELSVLADAVKIHLVRVDDRDLRAIYSGAIALIYPSLYEGFGLPILEAMACGCPVITCRNSSLPEVAGDAAIYVDEYDVAEMIQAIEQIQIPIVRQKLIQTGLKQAQKFSWKMMADQVYLTFIDMIQSLNTEQISRTRFSLLWQELRKEQIKLEQLQKQQISQKPSHIESYLEEIATLQKSLKLAQLEIEAMKTSKFWKFRSLWLKFKALIGLRL
ncbi:MAG: glycosyltransferase family 1 protein [Snowella sp.]|nr:glycosyltransferase family 1 protein [Snowella sp.]